MKTKDMTNGSIFKLLLLFALPLLIGNIFQQVYTIIDTSVVGHYVGDDAIAAIGTTSSIYSLLLNIVISMNSGYSIVVTRFFGAKNKENIKKSIAGYFILNLTLTLIITLFSILFLDKILYLMNTPLEIYYDTKLYIMILLAGMISNVIYNMFSSILRAFGNSITPLYFLIISCIINASSDIILVGLFDLGVKGAAIATVIAQSISGILAFIYVITKYKEYLPKKLDYKFDTLIYHDLITTGISYALMMCIVSIGSVVFSRANNNLGKDYITAFTSSRRIIEIFMLPLGTIATSGSVFIGQNYGASKLDRIKEGLLKIIVLEVIWGITAWVLSLILSRWLILLLTNTKNLDIINNALLSINISLPFYFILGILLALRTALQSMGVKLVPIISSIVELLIKILGAIILVPKLGYLGTCITEPSSWILMTFYIVIAFLICKNKIYRRLDDERKS